MIMGALSPTHWLIVVGVLVLLFGAKKLPEAARGLGRSARILKAEVNEMTTNGAEAAAPASAAQLTPAGADTPAAAHTAGAMRNGSATVPHDVQGS